MKKIKVCVFSMLLAMSVFALTACSTKDNNANNTTSAAGTQNTTTQGVTTGTSESTGMGTEGNRSESSTGVIGGIVDDVERGVNDVMDGTQSTTSPSHETTK